MKIESHNLGTVEVLTPIGALVEDDAMTFANALLNRLKGSSSRVVVSMQEVPYLDSVALEGFAEVADELSDRSVKLKMVQVTPTCREVFELTALSERLQFFEEIQDAVRSFL